MVHVIDSGKTGTTTLQLSGELTIENIKELKSSLEDSFNSSEHLVIDHSLAEDFDISYIQLLCSLEKCAKERSKKISFSEKSNIIFDYMLRDSGFVNSLLTNNKP